MAEFLEYLSVVANEPNVEFQIPDHKLETKTSMLGMAAFLLAVVAVIGAHYGPKYWLYVSVVSALLLGLALGWLRS
jgi:hypothetical protein